MKYFNLIWSNLRRKKLRSVLTMLSILVAFVLFAYLAAIRSAFSMGVEVTSLDRLMVRHKVSIIQPLPEAYEIRMERIDGVEDATFANWFGGVYQKPSNYFAQMAIKPEEFLEMFPEYVLSEDEKAAWFETRSGAIAGRQLADRFGWQIGDRIPIQSTIWDKKDGTRTWEFDLVGIYEGAEQTTDDSQFFFHHEYFHEARMWGQGQVGWYWVRIADPERAAEIAQVIDQEFANSPAETKAEPEGAFAKAFAEQIGNVGMILTAILSAVFFTILIVAGNTMAQAVRERIEEIGLLKAVGFTNRRVRRLVLVESCVMALLGGGLGLTIGWWLVSQGDPTGGALPIFYFPTRDLLIGIVLAVVLGVVAGIFPALRAQRLQVAEALRR